MMMQIELAGQWVRSVGGRDTDFVEVPGSYPPVGECGLTREFACNWPGDGPDRYFLCTDGVLATATFTLNGQEIGAAGPWATYRFPLPAGLLKSQNTVTATIRDIVEPFGPTPGRRFDAGLVRRIWIERRPRAFLADVGFTAVLSADMRSADCTVRVDIDGQTDAAVEIALQDRASGRVIARASVTAGGPARFTVDRPLLWSPELPNLYTLTATLPGDMPIVEDVGFRKLEVRQRDFYLNGNRLLLKGVCRHEFTHASGYSPSEAEVRRELAMIKHAGFNYIRLVHSPQARCVCRIAAELGILVSEEPGTCFHDLADPVIYGPAFEALRRTVLRDRNVPSIFAWLIYNECNPNVEYAVMAAKVCRELNPGCLLGMADCSGQEEAIKAMVKAADLSFYGINVYSYWPNDYCKRMDQFTDRPLVFTEWGGCMAQGNPRVLRTHCETFVLHAQPQRKRRIAGCSFWAWADYEEHSRPLNASVDGWTIEGLVDADGRPKPDLQQLSMMCFEMGREQARPVPKIEVLAQAPRREECWRPVDLVGVVGDQSAAESAISAMRQKRTLYSPWELPLDPEEPVLPRFGRLLVDGIEFHCREGNGLLLGPGRNEAIIPVGAKVKRIAVLGNVAMAGGYPASAIFSVHHRDAETSKRLGEPAGAYELVFADGKRDQPLRHGLEVLRSNNICRWWTPDPRAGHTKPAVRCVINKSYEVLRLDLWELTLDMPRELLEVRWHLADQNAILAMYGLAVELAE